MTKSSYLRNSLTVNLMVAVATICSISISPAKSNPVFNGADPDVLVAGDRYWIYPTTEPGEKKTFHAFECSDLQNWKQTAPILSADQISWLNDDKAPSHELWAPGIFKEGSKYFLYYAVGPQNPTPSRIGVATSDKPEGPFTDSGKPLVTGGKNFEAIDPMTFKDWKTGKVYLYCGGSAGPEMHAYELTADRLHVAKEVRVNTPENFTEGPFMHERLGTYYLSYSHGRWNDDSYCVCYSTSKSPLGPWTYRGQITKTNEEHAGPGHHAIFQNPKTGEWFIAYHRWNNAKRDNKMPPGRSVSIESLTYDKEGLINQIKMTNDGPTKSEIKDAPAERISDRLSRFKFGTDGEGNNHWAYVLTNKNGTSATVITYGATLTKLLVKDRNAKFGNVVLGFDNLSQYEHESPYFGATIGRVANRIDGAAFTLDGNEYKLAANNGTASLHGGIHGFGRKTWTAEPLPAEKASECSVKFSLSSPDGEEGFPGTVKASVTYTLTDEDKIVITYSARTDKATPVNLTNHSYFNLCGAGHQTILTHKLKFNADKYTPTNEHYIPTGELKSVQDTPFDFRKAKDIGKDIGKVPGGYDHNFVLNKSGEPLSEAGVLEEPESGRVMTMYTTEPGVQIYTGNFLDGTIEGNGGTYPKNSALCLEAQHFPDAVHHANFPSIILKPGKEYKQTTIYGFSTTVSR